MPAVISTTITFSSGNAITAARLNQIVSGSSFTSDAVTGTTLSVVGGQLKVGTITASELGTNSVTTVKIENSAVTTAKINDEAITAAKLGTDSVTSGKIVSGAVTIGKINTDNIALQTGMQNEAANKMVTADVVKYSPGVAKAYGNVTIAGTARTVSGAYNITSATRNSSTSTTITIDDNMANDNYVVQLTLYADGSVVTSSDAHVSSRAAGSFTIKHPIEGTPYEKIGFVVFGELA